MQVSHCMYETRGLKSISAVAEAKQQQKMLERATAVDELVLVALNRPTRGESSQIEAVACVCRVRLVVRSVDGFVAHMAHHGTPCLLQDRT